MREPEASLTAPLGEPVKTVTIECPSCEGSITLGPTEELNEMRKALDELQQRFDDVLNVLANVESVAKRDIASNVGEENQNSPAIGLTTQEETPEDAPKGKKVGGVIFTFRGRRWKYCSKCRMAKLANNEEFGPQEKSRTGLQSWCRTCHREYWRLTGGPRARQARKAKSRTKYPVVAGQKLCVICNIWKPVSKYYKSHTKYGKIRYKAACVTCYSKYKSRDKSSQYYKSHTTVKT